MSIGGENIMFKRRKSEVISTKSQADNQNEGMQNNIYKKGSELVLENIKDSNEPMSLSKKLMIARRNLLENKISDEDMWKILEYCFQHYQYHKDYNNDELFFHSKVNPLNEPQYIFKMHSKYLGLIVKYINSSFNHKTTTSEAYISNINNEEFNKFIKSHEKNTSDNYIYDLLSRSVDQNHCSDEIDYNDFFDDIDAE